MIDEKEHQTSVMVNAVLYVLSGVTQPILMAYAHHTGLANARCQLYMLFYYIGPASVAFSLSCPRRRSSAKKKGQSKCTDTKNTTTANDSNDMQQLIYNGGASTSYGSTSVITNNHDGGEYDIEDEERVWPSSRSLILKASAIALFDIFAQSMTYTGEDCLNASIICYTDYNNNFLHFPLLC